MSGDPRQWQVGMLGYGEVGRILAEDLRKQGVKVAAYDIKLDRGQCAPLRAHAAEIGVELAQSHADLAARADFGIAREHRSRPAAWRSRPRQAGSRYSSREQACKMAACSLAQPLDE